MPADRPAVGETWQMADPATGRQAQAVITDINETSVRMVSRQQRQLVFPIRSFRLMWKFVQEAPSEVCAHADCTDKGYLQIRDLGRWVWVCIQHLPTHTHPLLPVDNNLDNWTSDGEEKCPSCGSEANSEGSSVRDVEGYQVHRCGSCSTLWVQETMSDDEGEDFTGVWGGETVERLATVLETLGQQAQAFVGRTVWQGLLDTMGNGFQQRGISGVPVRMHTSNPLSVVLVGNVPKNSTCRGIQRLQPNRTGSNTPIPEVGSVWRSAGSDSELTFTVERIRYADQQDQPGRRIRIEGVDSNRNSFRIWLNEFLKEYEKCDLTGLAIEVPCSIGEDWSDSSGIVVKIKDVEDGQAVAETPSGGSILIPMYILKTRYTKVPPRRTVMDRLLDDE